MYSSIAIRLGGVPSFCRTEVRSVSTACLAASSTAIVVLRDGGA